ncbi:MAG: ester cyclase [Proteobacteria bacterium]|nr:ester cyclase [Pseudomonadota bacterium]
MTAADNNRRLVETFFNVMWNRWDDATMRDILDPTIDFRGSIGLQVTGHNGFAGYMQTIRDAFPDFHNRIDEIVATDDRAVARLTYTGTHDGPLFDHAATGVRIEYAGVAMFTMAGGKIKKVWVLGDRLALLQQIGAVTPVSGN